MEPNMSIKNSNDTADGNITPATRQACVERLAIGYLRFETLETRGRDSLDFRDCSIATIKRALELAYDMGAAAARAERGIDE